MVPERSSDSFIEKIRRLFDLSGEKENEQITIESIRQGVDFKGTNLWVLIFAIFLASLGLNINSTAVIIGAMLISPLMGPIMGIGMAVGINDFDLLQRAARNYAIASLIGITVSALYFFASPLSEARSELLARTTPTIYDVFIAFFGGMAGIVASVSRKKGNVIPGVAIATALMPPLCTAGFGVATGNGVFVLGALYLYFINSVFICFATLLTVRVLRFSPKVFVDARREKTVTRYIYLFVLLSLIPSVWMGVDIVKTSIYESNAARFITRELNFPNTQVVAREVLKEKGQKTIEVFLVGEEISAQTLSVAQSRLAEYGLSDVDLKVQQSLQNGISDVGVLKHMVLSDLYANSEARILAKDSVIGVLQQDLGRYRTLSGLSAQIAPEVRALYPAVLELSLSAGLRVHTRTGREDSLMIALVRWEKPPKNEERGRLEQWLKARTRSENLILVNQ